MLQIFDRQKVIYEIKLFVITSWAFYGWMHMKKLIGYIILKLDFPVENRIIDNSRTYCIN